MGSIPEQLSPSSSIQHRMYQALYEAEGFLSKQSLAQQCEISMPTLYQNLNGLIEKGLVRYSGVGPSTGGRRAQGLEFVSNARVSVGVSFTEQHLTLVAADLKLNELAFQEKEFCLTEYLRGKPDGNPLADAVEEFLNVSEIDRDSLLGVGIAIPGLLGIDQSRVSFLPKFGLDSVPVSYFTQGIPYPADIRKEAVASAEAEAFSRAKSSFVYLSLGNEIDGAVVIDGRLYTDNCAHDGEFGHICVEPGGLRCYCGHYGCLEAYCSGARIRDTFHVPIDDFFTEAENHNPRYEALLYNMLQHLAVALNNIHITLHCDILLGGSLSRYLQPYFPILRKYVLDGNTFASDADYVRLACSRPHIAPLGAALHFIHVFHSNI